MSACCSPLGPGSGPSPVAGALSALMPLAWSAGLRFSPMGGVAAAGFSGGTPAPTVAAAASSGSGASFGGLRFSPMPLGVGTSLVLGPASSALATASGGGPSLAAGVRFSPMGPVVGASALVLGAPTQANAFASGLQPVTFGRSSFAPTFAFSPSGGFQGTAQSFVKNVVVPGGGNINAQTTLTLSVTVPGVLASDSVFANQISAVFGSGVAIVNSFAGAANQVTVEIMNCSTSVQPIPTNFPLRVGILRG